MHSKQQHGFMPGKGTTDGMLASTMLMGAILCTREPRENLRQCSERKVVVLYEKIRNGGKVCATCSGYVRGKRNSGEVCSRNYRKFQGQGRTVSGISVKPVSVCCHYGQANR